MSAAQDRAARSRVWPATAPLELRNEKAVEMAGCAGTLELSVRFEPKGPSPSKLF